MRFFNILMTLHRSEQFNTPPNIHFFLHHPLRGVFLRFFHLLYPSSSTHVSCALRLQEFGISGVKKDNSSLPASFVIVCKDRVGAQSTYTNVNRLKRASITPTGSVRLPSVFSQVERVYKSKCLPKKVHTVKLSPPSPPNECDKSLLFKNAACYRQHTTNPAGYHQQIILFKVRRLMHSCCGPFFCIVSSGDNRYRLVQLNYSA